MVVPKDDEDLDPKYIGEDKEDYISSREGNNDEELDLCLKFYLTFDNA